ncbi:Zinc finger C-x8-C-x5-C-x3-H type (and similar) [Leishmania donovani]|uniref:Zinc finger C-x8-C-x5-C-x3-H type (And similar) family protein n=1 Tax=Leishmania donovani TaxID=5661 RepID=A0A504XZG8_LEIDO|nr:Zinc finger C-x8-C-x5-C-x3-H type (and similar) family protein [Leishmania donovani]CAJ1988713.1 Zinc finger C-x8-C-x5-C-x3-H type (and similar) [Leishmania donovani]VDZ44593.1 Zinc_finger_C-x8-C-x5-C-x3-H_type_(and_similar)_putative/Pfam:PF00642 [Leishmania donovani]
MSYSPHFGSHSSLPTVRVGSAANSMPAGLYGSRNMACSLESGTLLRPRQSDRASRSPLICSQRLGKYIAGMSSISAIDTASTKLSIPINAVEPTLAFEDDGLVPGLCRLFMEGRCRQGDRCFQVHANPSVVEQLRHEAFKTPSCCPAHGAKCNMEGFPLGLAVIIDPPREKESTAMVEAHAERENGSAAASLSNGETNMAATGGDAYSGHSINNREQMPIALHNVCPTRFLWSRYEENGGMLLHMPKSKICREHRKGLCRFGNECSFLHVCRQIPIVSGDEELLSHSRTPLRHSAVQGSMQDFSHPPSFTTASGSLCHHAHSQSHSQANLQPFQGSTVMSQNGSYMDGSLGNSQTSSRPHLSRAPTGSESYGGHQPLLRPLGGVQNSHSSVAARGSFSHNPYAEASSFQN